MTATNDTGSRERLRRLTLDFECLRSMPEGINDVRVWWDRLLGCEQVGKRVDISGLEHDEVLPEPATLKMIKHENVVEVTAAAIVDGYPAPLRVVEIVTPYFSRGSITDALLRGETFTATEAVAVTQAVLRGLSELHEVHRILHRDMKSGNILLASDHTVAKVADLGLAGRMDENDRSPALNNPTLYSPPELKTSGHLTRASDLYPLGLVLRELLAGNLPYASYSTSFIVERLTQGLRPVRSSDLQLPVWTPSSLRRIITKVEQSDPLRRFQHAREMDQALASATVVDWRQVDGELRWIAPFRHKLGRTVGVEARRRRNGTYSLSVKAQAQTRWVRQTVDVDVKSLDSGQLRRVFDQATRIASAR